MENQTSLIKQDLLAMFLEQRNKIKHQQQQEENQKKRQSEMSEALLEFAIYELHLDSSQIDNFISILNKINLVTQLRIYKLILKREQRLKRFHYLYFIWGNLPVSYSPGGNKKKNVFRIKLLEERITELEKEYKLLRQT